VAIAEHVAAFDKVTLAYGKRTYRTLDEMGWSDGVAYSATASAFIRTTREVVRRREESTE
jgi:hypothetical protein